jgi:hypothetical protein
MKLFYQILNLHNIINLKTNIGKMFLLILLICFCSAELRTNHIIYYDGYKLDYNCTIGQANYAIYRPTGKYRGKCSKFDSGDNFTYIDYDHLYTNYSLDRGHLAPYNDLGNASCNMNNIVPMYSGFNRGIWQNNERYLRSKYPGMWIVSGCKYNGKSLLYKNKVFYEIEGCYCVVFDQNPIDQNANIIHNGYIGYNGNSDELPWWINVHTHSDKHLTYLWSVALIFVAGFMLAFAIIIITMPKNNEYEV